MNLKKIPLVAAVFAALWLGARYVLPVALPFLLGALLALAAEPLVRPLCRRMKRGLAAGLGVSATLLGLGGILSLVGAAAVRELGRLAGAVPRLTGTARQGMQVLEDWLVGLSEAAPEAVRPALRNTVLSVFDDGTVFLQQATRNLPQVVTTTLGYVGSGVLGAGTALVAGFLISARLPALRQGIRKNIPEKWFVAAERVKSALGGWVKAQLKLVAVTWGIVTVGFVLLRIPYGLVWAALVAVVDAVPILGTGTVLVPWAVVCFLQGQTLRGAGLLCVYAASAVTRTVLEPKLVGHQLGLDPLVTLIALYVGFRFWGFAGLLLAPILASAAKSLLPEKG